MPQVSVVIPAYNAITYLPETIKCLAKQTFDDFEVIIVDDGSLDETAQWVSQLQDPRIKLITQVNQGSSGARNTGIKHSQGEFIAFMDADDFWQPTKLEKQVEALQKKPEVALVYTWVAYIDEAGKPTGRIVKHNAEGQVWEKFTERNLIECGSVPMIRRHCFENVGLFDTSIDAAPDWDMWLRLAACYPFAVIKEPLVSYRQHSNNKSKNYPKLLHDFRTIIEKAFQSAPFEVLHLRNRSYGNLNLLIAWKCIQSKDKDYKKADLFRRQALKHDFKIIFSKEYIRLSVAIAIMKRFSPNGYNQFVQLMYALRRRVSSVSQPTNKS
ncbi:glycosyltransferase family 2 protein [Anabaena subtropica]|uniref:Glycosyltransferase family 2 protein n=1 Tax=Anabaena subtropica FACHB-260 TaxID=2692884 RepID=A0ABR8CQ76_9NOST|nr:glycosyltransferase family 2 protein [Anabaena subtropica]MBD2345352.1 glycosyltransferase family 2 protein [Anabaena subtropica FACHB-260]